MTGRPVQAQLALDGAAPQALRGAPLNPDAWVVHPGWAEQWQTFRASGAGLSLAAFLRERSSVGANVYPPQPLRALALADPATVRVVILGQDPYHGPGQAEGLAFSVAPGVRPPPSLKNIFKEIERDTGRPPAVYDSLVPWAAQGVLLLNTCLTVEDGLPASHARRGWEILTDGVIRHCSETGPAKAFLLWGAHAQKKAGLIDTSRHLVLRANHPSPLSATRGPEPFIGCGHFGQTNRWLTESGSPAVRW
ncbi:MAG: uracil-DNA glycosylase [Hydrogenophaga sp.]|nr:uracil-DNA glycosylase [Hydrogenophaga sp.]